MSGRDTFIIDVCENEENSEEKLLQKVHPLSIKNVFQLPLHVMCAAILI